MNSPMSVAEPIWHSFPLYNIDTRLLHESIFSEIKHIKKKKNHTHTEPGHERNNFNHWQWIGFYSSLQLSTHGEPLCVQEERKTMWPTGAVKRTADFRAPLCRVGRPHRSDSACLGDECNLCGERDILTLKLTCVPRCRHV